MSNSEGLPPPGKEAWSRSRIVLAAGALVFIVGLLSGIYFANLHDRQTKITDDSVDYASEVIGTYGMEEGEIRLVSFLSDPHLLEMEDAVSGNPAKVTLTLSDGRTFTQYYPSRDAFDSGGIGSTENRFVNVDLGGGSTIPGTMEVTVVEA